jgi:hypothetical protein
MSVSGTQIRVKAFPRLTALQTGLLVGLLVTALAGGLVVGRVTAPARQLATASQARPVVSARELVGPRIARELAGMDYLTASSVRPAPPRVRRFAPLPGIKPSLEAALIAWTIKNCTGWKPTVHVC